MDSGLRRATIADEAVVAALTEAAYAPYTALFGYPPLPVTEDYAPRIARGEVWLLEQGLDLLGLIALERADDHILIFSVAVAPHHQGRGVGRKLLDFAEEQARLLGLSEVRLYTNALMERNIAIYKGRGYVETCRRPNPKRPGWTVVDMAKGL